MNSYCTNEEGDPDGAAQREQDEEESSDKEEAGKDEEAADKEEEADGDNELQPALSQLSHPNLPAQPTYHSQHQ